MGGSRCNRPSPSGISGCNQASSTLGGSFDTRGKSSWERELLVVRSAFATMISEDVAVVSEEVMNNSLSKFELFFDGRIVGWKDNFIV